MKWPDDNYYSRRCQQAYENGRKDGMAMAFVTILIVWGLVAILMKLG